MKKIFFLLMAFCSIKAISQDTLYIDINGRFYDLTINKKSTNFYIGGGNAYNDQVYIYANTKDTFTIYINCANCTWNLGTYKLKANLIYINGTKTTSITNLKNILGTIFTASNSGGGGGGGSYTFAGNIVSQIGNNVIINQLQPDWNAISGLGSIANKPNIPILDSSQFVKLRDSNKNNNGFITPSFFFNNRGSGTKWSNFNIGGYLVQKLNDSTYTINRDNTTIQDSIRLNATIVRFVGDSIKRDTSIANRVIGGSVDTIANVITLNKTNGGNINLQLRKTGGGGGGITNDTTKVSYIDSTGGITGKNTFVTPNYLQKYLTTGIKNNYLKYIEVIPFQPSGFFNTGIHLSTPTNIYKMYNNGNTYIRYLPAGIGSGAGAGYGKLVVDSPGTYFIFNAFRVETPIPPLTTVRYTIDHIKNRFSSATPNPIFYASYTTFSYLLNGAVGQEQQQQFLFQNYNKGDTIYTCFNSLTDVAIDQDTFSRFFLVKLTDLGANITNGGGGTTDTTSLSNRINGKLDVARFVGDSIRWDTAIANRVISQRIDTNLNRIYYKKTNGKIDSLQLKINGSGGGGVASISNLLTSSLLNNTITSNVNGQTSTANIQAGEVYRKTTQSFSVNLSYSLSNSAYTINTRTLSVFGGLIENQIKYTQNITLTNGSANANIGGAVPNTIVAGNLMEINGDIYRIISVNLNIATLNKSYTGTTNTFITFSVFSNPINLNVSGIVDANSYKLALVKTLDSAYRIVDKRYKITWGTIGAFNIPINVNFDGSGVPPPPESEFYVYDITQNLPISEAKFELYNQNSLLPISWSNSQFFFDSLYLSNTNQNIANQLIAGNKIKLSIDTLNKYKVTISVLDTASISGQTFGTTSVYGQRYHSGIVPFPPAYISSEDSNKIVSVLQLPIDNLTNTYFENSGYGLINGIPYIFTPAQFDPNKGSPMRFPTSITQKSDISFDLYMNTYKFQYNANAIVSNWIIQVMVAKDSMINKLQNPVNHPIEFFDGGVGEESFLWRKYPTIIQTDSTVTISNGIGIIKSDFVGNNTYTGSNNNYYLYLIVRGQNNESFNRIRTFSQNTNDYNMDMRISLQGQGGGSGGSTTTQTNWLVYIQQNDSVVKISDSTTFTTPEATIKAEVYAIYSAGYPIVYRTYPITYQYPSQSIVRGYIQALDYILNVNPITTPNIQITNILTKRNQRY